MAEAKTQPTSASVEEYLASKASPEQLADCKALMVLLKKVTNHSPKMWVNRPGFRGGQLV